MINQNNPDYTLHPAHPARKNIQPRLAAWEGNPVLTIVTPFYNTGGVFRETATSILRQTLQQWEWLIINDGSTDPSALQLLEEFRHLDSRIRVIDHAENRGLSAARNSGFANARCETVLLLDSDDLLEPTAAEKWWWFLETHPEYGFVASYHVAFGGMNFLWTGGFHDGAMNAERNRVSMMCAIRKSVHAAVGGFDEANRGGLEDWEFWMRCAAHGYWGATVPEYLAWYRYRADHSDRWNNLQEARLAEFRTVLQSKYPGLYNGGFPELITAPDYDLTTINMDIPAFNKLEKTGPHLLFVLPWLVMGGAERFALNLIDQLMERGWSISIVTTSQSDNPWLYEFEKRTPLIFMLPNFIPMADYPRFIGYYLQSRDIDTIFLQGSPEGYRMLPYLRMQFPQIPILDYLHFITPDWMQGGFPKLSLLYKDFIDFSLVSSEQVSAWMVEAGRESDRLKVCYTGIDPNYWKPVASLREKMRLDSAIAQDETVILYAARLEEQKQPEVFVETLARLKEKGRKFLALVAGEGSLKARLEKQIYANRLQMQVRLLGSVPAENMPAMMAMSDIFFLPSKDEGISLAIYEAMASGLVVVGADVGGQRELVTPECGVLIPPGTQPGEAIAYADILHGLIGDPVLRQSMSQASRQRIIEKFTLQQMGECIHDVLVRAIDNKKSSREQPVSQGEKQCIARETQSVVEYLQARRELKALSQKYSVLVEPKRPSHWFYLWIRQIFLPTAEHAKSNRLGRTMVVIQQWLRRTLIKE